MKLPLLEQVQQALNTRKKNGDPVFDQDNLEVCVAGTFAGDKIIVIKTPTPRVDSNPDPELKPHHEFGGDWNPQPGTGWPLKEGFNECV